MHDSLAPQPVEPTEPAPTAAPELLVRRYGARIGEFRFLLSDGQAHELMPLPPSARLPLSPPELTGVVNVRGVLAPLFDLARLPAHEGGEPLHHDPSATPMMLLARSRGEAYGLVVDGMVSTLSDAQALAGSDATAAVPAAMLPVIGKAWLAAGAVWFEFDAARLLEERASAQAAPEQHAHVL